MEAARSILRSVFAMDDFRSGQGDIVQAVLEGRDVLGVLPTGGGKSLCYQIPSLVFPACTLVISPLIALMTDQVTRLKSYRIAAECLHGGQTQQEQDAIVYAAHTGRLKLLYVAPERLQSSVFLSQISSVGLSLVAVDEAHCISEWGHDFRPAYRSISQLFSHRSRVPIVALTATATPDVRADIIQALNLQKPTVIVRGFDRPNLTFQVVNTTSKVETITEYSKRNPQHSVLVYGGSRRKVETIADELNKRKVPTVMYHAGKSSAERDSAQHEFISGRVQVLVATNAFGMGIDKPNIRKVFHTDLALTLEAYYQEAGRAGRDGERAECTLLYDRADVSLMNFFIACTYPDEKRILHVLRYLWSKTDSTALQKPILADADSIAVDIHSSRAVVQGVLNLLEREGVLLRTAPNGTTQIIPMTPSSRLKEYVQHLPQYKRKAAETIYRYVANVEAGHHVPIRVSDVVKNGGITSAEFRETIRSLVTNRLITYRQPDQGGGIVLFAEQESDSRIPIDMDNVHRRRSHAQDKLQMMLHYAETKQCKRNVILEYFGDTGTTGTCGRCSSCSPIVGRGSRTTNITSDEIHVVRCVHELSGRFGRNVVTDVLTGTVSDRVVQYRLDRSSLWGTMSRRSRIEVIRVIDAAISHALLVRTGTTYPLLATTPLGARLASPLPRPLDVVSKGRNAQDHSTLKALLELRNRIAEQENVVPGAVISVEALERLAADQPQTLAELTPGSHGSGLFLARYGEDVVETVKRVRKAELADVPKIRADDQTMHAAQLADQCRSLDELAKRMRITHAMAAHHLQRALESGIEVNISGIVPDTLLTDVSEFLRQNRYARLRHIREHIGESVSLPLLRVAMAAARRILYGVNP